MDDDEVVLVLPRAVLDRILAAIAALQAGDRAGCGRLLDEAIFLQTIDNEPDEVAYQA